MLVAALLLQIVASPTRRRRRPRGAALATVDALDMVLVAVLVFLLMRQVMPIAAALAGGVSLNSFGSVSRLRTGAGSALPRRGAARLRSRPAH